MCCIRRISIQEHAGAGYPAAGSRRIRNPPGIRFPVLARGGFVIRRVSKAQHARRPRRIVDAARAWEGRARRITDPTEASERGRCYSTSSATLAGRLSNQTIAHPVRIPGKTPYQAPIPEMPGR